MAHSQKEKAPILWNGQNSTPPTAKSSLSKVGTLPTTETLQGHFSKEKRWYLPLEPDRPPASLHLKGAHTLISNWVNAVATASP